MSLRGPKTSFPTRLPIMLADPSRPSVVAEKPTHLPNPVICWVKEVVKDMMPPMRKIRTTRPVAHARLTDIPVAISALA